MPVLPGREPLNPARRSCTNRVTPGSTKRAGRPNRTGNTTMQFFDVIAITMAILGFFLSLQGLWLVCRALWPERVQAAAGRCRRNGVKCLLVGLVVTAAVSAVSGDVGAGLGAPGQLIAWVVFGVYLMYAGVGMAGLA